MNKKDLMIKLNRECIMNQGLDSWFIFEGSGDSSGRGRMRTNNESEYTGRNNGFDTTKT